MGSEKTISMLESFEIFSCPLNGLDEMMEGERASGTENEIPLQEYDSRFQECCDHVSKEEVGKECASKGCYERASYVVLECEAREPLFHPSLAHITHSCHLYNEDHSSNS